MFVAYCRVDLWCHSCERKVMDLTFPHKGGA